MEMQSASAVLLVRPAGFGFNADAARSNVFSHPPADEQCAAKALAEFEGLAQRLSDAGVETLVLDDTAAPWKPDAVFPNNWMSTHADGTLGLFPMATAPRRLERRADEVRDLFKANGFEVRQVVDLSGHEQDGRFLEGTGSLILDRPRRRAFASRSLRTHPDVVHQFDESLGYSTLLFDARDRGGRPIYHTNVLLSLGTSFAVVCIDAIAPDDRARVLGEIEASGREIVDLSFDQLRCFGCNLIELQGRNGPVIALSKTALTNLREDQVKALEAFGELVDVEIPTIEAVGGGSVRCMIAEVHLPRVNQAT